MTQSGTTGTLSQPAMPIIAFIASVCAVNVAMFTPNLASAQEFECSISGDKRFIRLEIPGEKNLCEVTVTHDDNDRRVMWYANNETLFCSAKIYELRNKYVEKWKFNCSEWLDTGGIDKLSERHRTILDGELKARIQAGKSASPKFRVTGVKAVASTPLNLAPGNLAVQYFMVEEGSTLTTDTTQIIFDDGSEWRSVATLKTLSNYIVPEEKSVAITSALVHEISDTGVLHVNTIQSAPSDESSICQGSQTLLVSENDVAPRSPHRVFCPN